MEQQSRSYPDPAPEKPWSLLRVKGRGFTARQFSWRPCPKVKVDRVGRDLGPRSTLSCHHHFKFTCLRVPGGDPKYSFLTSLSRTPAAFSLGVDILGHPIPRGSKMPSEPSLEADSIRAASSISQRLRPHLSPAHRLSRVLGASPRTGILVAGEFCVSKALGRPHPSSPAWFSILRPVPGRPPLTGASTSHSGLAWDIITHLALLPSHQTQHLASGQKSQFWVRCWPWE